MAQKYLSFQVYPIAVLPIKRNERHRIYQAEKQSKANILAHQLFVNIHTKAEGYRRFVSQIGNGTLMDPTSIRIYTDGSRVEREYTISMSEYVSDYRTVVVSYRQKYLPSGEQQSG
ncbi:hypothetical protein EVAR_73276_1 [Eumeta japonica]|uniref:Uncharacterized protein n=1 Tax=Eumeta variegata TaxID=151549 RepID=A0A4C1T412_EUMVA|nr:hypothetical protein EVAR_73276_1 [Eumeta japonica]